MPAGIVSGRVFALVLGVAAVCFAADTAGKIDTSKVDAVFAAYAKPGSPGAAVSVVQNGQMVYAKGYGLANLEYDIPITPSTIFHVASVSKQFTAMCLVLLAQDGKLSLDDDIRQHLPELQDYGSKVTVRQLLSHTGGIRDQWELLGMAGWRLDDVITQDQIFRMLTRQRELNFTPGERNLYSNGGYSLAAEIVKRVSGKPLREFAKERIFDPLGMTNTHFHDDHTRIVKNRAYSYAPAGNGYRAAPLNYANVGATSLFTTAEDLARWAMNFLDAKVGGKSALDELEKPAVLNSGKPIEYALGVATTKNKGLRTFSHGGADAGYRSYLAIYPDQRFAVAVLSNIGTANTGRLASDVAGIYLGDVMQKDDPKPPVAERKPVVADPKTFDSYAGKYRVENGMIIEVVRDGDRLMASPPGQPRLELTPVGDRVFYAKTMNVELDFERGDGAKAQRFVLVQGSSRMTANRLDETPITAEQMQQYAGSYWSAELGTRYDMVVRDGKLIATHHRHPEITLIPAGVDRFGGSQWFLQGIAFERNAAGAVSGMRMSTSRVLGVHFEKTAQ